MTFLPQFINKKNLGLDQQRQPNIFVLQAVLKKLHRGNKQLLPPPHVK